MKAQVKSVESPEYARIIVLRLAIDDGKSIKIDIPIKLLDEAGIKIGEGDNIEIELKDRLEDTESWNIIYSCKVYMERGGKMLISCGGLQASLDSSLVDIRTEEKIYIYVRKI